MASSSSNTAGQPNNVPRNDSEGQTAGAFDIIVPSASTFVASSSGTKYNPCDIFINHCGQDTKYNVASWIYDSLVATGLRVFLDKDELRLGDLLPKALEEAMAGASICIAIFSEHYAQSPWCLAELEYMVKNSKTIIPVFYHVDPSVLRWAEGEEGGYADAFSDHKNKGRYAPEVLQGWKKALQDDSCCIGEIIRNNENGHMAVKNVVNRIMKEMDTVPLEVAKHSVGLDEIVRDFDDTIAHQYVASNTVGIWGLSGSGKTTLAKEIFNKRSSAMDKSSFLFDLGEANLVDKQKKLLEDLGVKDVSFDHVDKGKEIMETKLSEPVSMLIVLDDVNHTDQLDALLPPKKSLGDKSLIIVTTRDANVLQQRDISAIYQTRPLKDNHAKELFCRHAFLRNSPLSELLDLVEKFVDACQGLPLSLKVLGGQLYGKTDKDYWQRTFNKFSDIPHTDIKKRLKVSYDALEKRDQEMFLDTACLFIGERKTAAIAAWDAECEGLLGWQTLFNKCLVEEDKDGLIRMHGHLRDLGRDIANGQSPHRLWSPHQIIEITPQQEAVLVRGIASAVGENCYQRQGKIIINTSQGERSITPHSLGLKIFVGNGEFLNEEHSELSRELIWLQCNKFKHKYLPSWLALEKLRILELFDSPSLEYLWERDADSPLELREMVIQRCKSLRGFPKSIGDLKNLKKILINDDDRDSCFALSFLPQQFCSLQSLEHLEIRHCPNLSSLPGDFGNLSNLQRLHLTNLSSLPSNFGELTNLRHLQLRSCITLEVLPDSFKKLTLLEYLDLKFCQELSIKSELHVLESMSKLRYLNLEGCRKLEDLHLPEVASLTELRLIGNGFRELPANIFELPKLTKLEIGSELLTKLPTTVGNWSPLTALTIKKCKNLKSLPDSLEHLNLLKYLTIENTGVKYLPKSLIHLENLTIEDTPISELSFGSRCKLKSIDLKNTEVSKISIGEDCCPVLETLNLHFNQNLRELETLPGTLKTLNVFSCEELKDIRGVRGLKELKRLEFVCLGLEEVPCFAELVSLEHFTFNNGLPVKKIDGLQELSSLKTLSLQLDETPSFAKFASLKVLVLIMCLKLEKVEDLEHLKSLEKLEINFCPQLEALQGLAELISLKEFDLSHCSKLEKMEGLENIKSLRNLKIDNCSNLDVLPSLSKLTSLREFGLTTCRKLKKIEGLENIKSLEDLKIIDCPELEVLGSLQETTSLKNFQLEKCQKLKKIEGIENMILLEKLKIYNCSELDGLPSLAQLTCLKKFDLMKSSQKLEKIKDLQMIKSLEKFKISDCPGLEVLSLPKTSSLKKIELEKCHKLKKIKGLENIGPLKKLRVFDCPKLDGLSGLAELTSLKELDLRMCHRLEKMDSLENIRSLEKLNISDCPELDALLSLPETTSLKKFQLKKCHKLKNIKGLENLRSLEMLRVYDCAELDGLPGLGKLTSLEEIDLQMCPKLVIEGLENIRSLEKLRIYDYQGLDGLPNLPETAFLKEIHLKNCQKLKKVDGLENKRSLEKLRIYDCPDLEGLPGLRELTSLQEFDLEMCHKLKMIEGLENIRSLEKLRICNCPELDGLPRLAEFTFLKEIDLQWCHKLEKIDGLKNIRSLEKLKISHCLNLAGLLSLEELASLNEFCLEGCPKLEKLGIYDCPLRNLFLGGALNLAELTSLKGFSLERCPKLLMLRIYNCPQLDGLNLAELTSLIRINLESCPKLKKIEGLENIRSLGRLEISDCSELEALPSLSEITSLQRLELKKSYKLEKIEGLQRLKLLKELKVHTRWNAPCIVSLEHSERLESLVVVANHISAVPPFVSNLQKWPSEVTICTRVFDVGLLKSFFKKLPYVSVLDYSDMVEVGSSHGGKRLELRRPERSANANAILRCFIIDSHHPDLLFSTGSVFGSESEPFLRDMKDKCRPLSEGYVPMRRQWRSMLDPFSFNTELESSFDSLDKGFVLDPNFFRPESMESLESFNTELDKGKWVWMGVSSQSISKKDYIYAKNSKGEDVDVKVEAAWVVMGERYFIEDAFLQLFQRPNQGVRNRRCWIKDKGLCTCSHKAVKR